MTTHRLMSHRTVMALFSACWFTIGIANLGISDELRWNPQVPGMLALACSACTGAMFFCPQSSWFYRLGGTFAIGTIAARTGSIVLGVFFRESPDAPWYTAATIGITIMLGVLYWRWWLTEVSVWHLSRKDAGRLADRQADNESG